MPFSEEGIRVNRSIAIVGIIAVGVAGIVSLTVLAITGHSDATTVGQIVTFAGTIVAALVAYLMGAKTVEEARINRSVATQNASRLDEIHAKVNGGGPTVTTLENGGIQPRRRATDATV